MLIHLLAGVGGQIEDEHGEERDADTGDDQVDLQCDHYLPHQQDNMTTGGFAPNGNVSICKPLTV